MWGFLDHCKRLEGRKRPHKHKDAANTMVSGIRLLVGLRARVYLQDQMTHKMGAT